MLVLICGLERPEVLQIVRAQPGGELQPKGLQKLVPLHERDPLAQGLLNWIMVSSGY